MDGVPARAYGAFRICTRDPPRKLTTRYLRMRTRTMFLSGVLSMVAWTLAAESSTPPERVVVSADGFSGYAADYARSKGFAFTDGAARLVRQVAEESANQIFASPELSRDGLIADAKSTFTKLVDSMIES